MTNVKTIDYTKKDGVEYIKVTFKDDSVIFLDTDVCAGKEAVLDDLDKGEFDYFFADGYRDTPISIAKWDKDHPAVERIYGE